MNSNHDSVAVMAAIGEFVRPLPHYAPLESLGAPLGALLEVARAAWPEIRLRDEDFVRFLAERLAPPSLASDLAKLHGSDLFVTCGCANGDAAALASLEACFISTLPRSLRRIDPSSAFIDEVVQSVRRRLLLGEGGRKPRILDYTGRGSLSGWLRVLAMRTAQNQRKAVWRERGLDTADEHDLVAGAVDAEQALMKGQLREHFQSAFCRALDSLSAEDRNLLRLHVVDGLSIDRLAPMFLIHRSTAARRIERVRWLLNNQIRQDLADAAGIPQSEMDSALKLVCGDQDLCLHCQLT
jgi:RNA polymerase sigma-70 factor (ECF subfamily)